MINLKIMKTNWTAVLVSQHENCQEAGDAIQALAASEASNTDNEYFFTETDAGEYSVVLGYLYPSTT